MASMEHHDQGRVGRKGLIYLTYASMSLSIIEGSQDKNSHRKLEAGADAEAMEECCLLACSSWFAKLAIL